MFKLGDRVIDDFKKIGIISQIVLPSNLDFQIVKIILNNGDEVLGNAFGSQIFTHYDYDDGVFQLTCLN